MTIARPGSDRIKATMVAVNHCHTTCDQLRVDIEIEYVRIMDARVWRFYSPRHRAQIKAATRDNNTNTRKISVAVIVPPGHRVVNAAFRTQLSRSG